MRVLLVRPDVSAPLHAVVMFFAGAAGGVSAWVLYATGLASMCGLLPVFSASTALAGILPWSLRRARVGFGGRRLAIACGAVALLAGIEAIRCRFGS